MQAMVVGVLDQQKAVCQVFINDHKSAHLIITWQDVEVLKSLNKTLAPLLGLTDSVSGEDYVTMLYNKPLLHHLPWL